MNIHMIQQPVKSLVAYVSPVCQARKASQRSYFSVANTDQSYGHDQLILVTVPCGYGHDQLILVTVPCGYATIIPIISVLCTYCNE